MQNIVEIEEIIKAAKLMVHLRNCNKISPQSLDNDF